MELYEYERAHAETVRALGAECTVLLKTDGAFPLDGPCPVALYGSGARNTIKGGTGSGEVNSRYSITVEAGLEEAGFTVTSKDWLDAYDQTRAAAQGAFYQALFAAAANDMSAGIAAMGAVMPEPEYELPLNCTVDTAIYVLGRISGEGSDRNPVRGDVLLTETEVRDILELNRSSKNFILVLNTGGVVDLSPVMEVRNILVLSQLGTETGRILADLLLGKAFPSGKLTTTWAAWGEYPAMGDFGDINDTHYTEGVYVGYRYFNAVGKKPLFPFGYGIGYTTFSVVPGAVSADGDRITVQATVTNTGSRPGKETVQVYVQPPQGKLDKPMALAAFAKTETLNAGASETVSISFPLRDIASYDESISAWVLEPGRYAVLAGTSSADLVPAAAVDLDAGVVTMQCRPCGGKPNFTDWTPDRIPAPAEDYPIQLNVSASSIPTETVVYDTPRAIDPITDSLTDEELAYLCIGAFDPNAAGMSIIGNAGQTVAGSAGESYGKLADKGIPALVMADGPAGLRLSREYYKDADGAHSLGTTMPESILAMIPPEMQPKAPEITGPVYDQYCTAIPIGTAIAQSWNPALAEACGDLVGDEMERFGVHLWLAPALNIHRDIRCGRNFEYFSEDPLISGVFAAAITKGVQKHPGCGTTVKHYCCNNQENNRYFSNSQVSERALREIYLKGFGIAVRDSQPHALMTSYNLLNGEHISQRKDILEDILRDEFGFRGLVMTDWVFPMPNEGCHPGPCAAKITAAGNDIAMPGTSMDLESIKAGLQDGTVTRERLQIDASRTIRIAKMLAGK